MAQHRLSAPLATLLLLSAAGASAAPTMQDHTRPLTTTTTEPATVQRVAGFETGSNPNAPLQASLRAGLGYVNGELNEYVYDQSRKVSQLVWNIDNLLMGNIGTTVRYKKWLALNADYWFRLTEGNGDMQDYDWFYDTKDWSHFSDSSTDITSASMIDINLDAVFFRYARINFRGIVGFKRDNFKFEDHGGHYIYSVYGWRDSSGTFPDTPGITYDQTMTSGYLGLGFSTIFSNRLELSGRVIYSPIVNSEDTDNHHLRSLYFEDDGGNSGDLVAFNIAFNWYFSRHFSWNSAFAYQRYSTMHGDTRTTDYENGTVETYSDGAGMNQRLTMFSTGLTYSF